MTPATEAELPTKQQYKPGDTFEHPDVGQLIAVAELYGDGCVQCVCDTEAGPRCATVPVCWHIVWILNTPESKQAYIEIKPEEA